MDPQANIVEQVKLASRIMAGIADEHDIDRLADLVTSLDDWMRAGNFLPSRWMVNRQSEHVPNAVPVRWDRPNVDNGN